ncbi:hypothetical protein L6452_23338 [Arctium lappa]|uniref:Uncharacterized protein n=1 Tax=Arctium lappa TaxID=4217 RepID=A0ACB9B2L3_ARCLA|nr:hypothetical protein L6452_23338 [Arctium lappa]
MSLDLHSLDDSLKISTGLKQKRKGVVVRAKMGIISKHRRVEGEGLGPARLTVGMSLSIQSNSPIGVNYHRRRLLSLQIRTTYCVHRSYLQVICTFVARILT